MLCDKVRSICGVDLSQYKRGQMERRVRTWASHRGTSDLSELATQLRRDQGMLEAFLDRITINVSGLWRHPEQWDTLAKVILPELSERGTIRAWSAGCSYGAEAHTMAAVCKETAPDVRVDIRGTDLDVRMLERARAGLFSAEETRIAPRAVLKRHFTEQPDGGWQANPELRKMLSFDRGDLLRMPLRANQFDLVFCRNTVIYFTDEVRDRLHERIAEALKPGGWFVVGTSERVTDPGPLGLESKFPFIYRKR